MRQLFLGSLLALSLAACDSRGGGNGPTAPPPPPQPPVSVAGVWSGLATSVSAEGTCLADSFQPGAVDALWVFRQSGRNVTASQTLNHTFTCFYAGTVTGSTLSLLLDLADSPALCSLQSNACTRPSFRAVRMELLPGRSPVTGTVQGGRMFLDGTSVWRVFDTRNEQSLGELTVRQTQDLQRQ
jgi:hypothetical protein